MTVVVVPKIALISAELFVDRSFDSLILLYLQQTTRGRVVLVLKIRIIAIVFKGII